MTLRKTPFMIPPVSQGPFVQQIQMMNSPSDSILDIHFMKQESLFYALKWGVCIENGVMSYLSCKYYP